jgi:hypothetical protein
VFFETVSSGASHVGIALGGGEFVHAPSSRGVVRIERYTSGYWADRCAAGGRSRTGVLIRLKPDPTRTMLRGTCRCERGCVTMPAGTPASPGRLP